MNNPTKNPLKIGDEVKLSKTWMYHNEPERLLLKLSEDAFRSSGVVTGMWSEFYCVIKWDENSSETLDKALVWPYTALIPVEKPHEVSYPNPPHKHAKVIKAWADGAEIQIKLPNCWHTLSSIPEWGIEEEYRIKPQKESQQLDSRKESILLAIDEIRKDIAECFILNKR